ncbi:hypothetical protein BCV69DRAFT_282179 [Microstroma glucosiphilum]|uniref:Uncharacterized protein n=1 Tax=Pseudomicrostroma glucosiphilum TaxID=1684307 RepID=A0A316U9F5_9BASI|nr:hypothetical protein BCV69DRAFT_282179 [Pseudomicrostroma glucosiphilum]PWN21458.1 hypothetical protein BCV69DRAFT_282179 [Pseudomicrostroma glucosiphilum]
MAALIMYSTLALQPHIAGWLERTKARRDSRARGDPDLATPSAASRIATSLSFGKSRKGKGKQRDTSAGSAPGDEVALDAATVLHTLLLLLLVKKIKTDIRGDANPSEDHGRVRSTTPPSSSKPAEESDYTAAPSVPAPPDEDVPPQYSLADPVDAAAEASSAVVSDPDVAWRLYLTKALSRLELFCLEILPVASQFVQGSRTSERSHCIGDSQKKLPDSVIPPLDVCIAWAALLGNSMDMSVLSMTGSFARLRDWHLPLAAIAAVHARSDGAQGAAEKLRSLWTQSTSTPFHLQSGASSQDKGNGWMGESDLLSGGLRVCCPAPTCSFSARVPFIGEAGSETSRSRRGLVDSKWRRKCQSCGQTVSLDTLVGRKLIADVQRWCDASSSSYDEVAFAGLLSVNEGQAAEDVHRPQVLASQILSPLFSPALSRERVRRNEALEASGSLGSNGPASSNSLGAAMRTAAVNTIATSPQPLGASLSYSYASIETWLLESTLLVNPLPALAGSAAGEAAPMDQYSSTPDRVGGGFSASGANFNMDNPYEEEGAKLGVVQIREKRARLVRYVHALLEPYKSLAENGMPSVRNTAEADEGAEEWTDVVPRLDRQVTSLARLGSEVEKWREQVTVEEGQVSGSESAVNQGAAGKGLSIGDGNRKSNHKESRTAEEHSTPALSGDPKPPSISTLILTSYLTALSELKSDGSDWSSQDAEDVLNGAGTPIEVRVGRLAHELSRTRCTRATRTV